MPRYFFNVYHDKAELDREGEELPDMQAAWREATVTAGQIIQDLDGKLRPGKDRRIRKSVVHHLRQRRPGQVNSPSEHWAGRGRERVEEQPEDGRSIWGSANRVTTANGRWRRRPRLRPLSPIDDRVHGRAAGRRPFRGREVQFA
jgi:hypothetical protein